MIRGVSEGMSKLQKGCSLEGILPNGGQWCSLHILLCSKHEYLFPLKGFNARLAYTNLAGDDSTSLAEVAYMSSPRRSSKPLSNSNDLGQNIKPGLPESSPTISLEFDILPGNTQFRWGVASSHPRRADYGWWGVSSEVWAGHVKITIARSRTSGEESVENGSLGSASQSWRTPYSSPSTRYSLIVHVIYSSEMNDGPSPSYMYLRIEEIR